MAAVNKEAGFWFGFCHVKHLPQWPGAASPLPDAITYSFTYNAMLPFAKNPLSPKSLNECLFIKLSFSGPVSARPRCHPTLGESKQNNAQCERLSEPPFQTIWSLLHVAADSSGWQQFEHTPCSMIFLIISLCNISNPQKIDTMKWHHLFMCF